MEAICKGKPASAFDKVSGRAVICKNEEEAEKITEGDILITHMTDIEFVPAMKKATAIITAVGGTLCHASIQSRQLKKPCIVGASNVLSLIKNGQDIIIHGDGNVYLA